MNAAEQTHAIMSSDTGFTTFTKVESFPKREAAGVRGKQEEQKLEKWRFPGKSGVCAWAGT